MALIVIADDHAVVRRGLREMIEDHPGHTVVGNAANAEEVFHILETTAADLVILDLNMPGLSGLDILSEIRRSGKTMPVLILSIHPEEQFAVRAFRAGASGYITKESAPDELLSAIDLVLSGKKYISKAFSQHLVQSLGSDDSSPPHEQLSAREFQVLRLIASGKTVSQIGTELSLSVKTISTYRSRILDKMGMETNAQLTRYAIEHGLLAS